MTSRPAQRLDAAQLRAAGHRLLEVVDPYAAEAAEARRLEKDEDAAAARTWFATWDDGEGTTHLDAKIATRHSDMLHKALHAIAMGRDVTRARAAGSDRGRRRDPSACTSDVSTRRRSASWIRTGCRTRVG